MEKWIVTAVDTSESSDGKPRVLKVCDTQTEAAEYVRKDMDGFVEDAKGMELITDYSKMSIHTSDYQYGCEWNIENVKVA